ncbi:SIR2 family NAD-dependent protein deacylase [Cryptosporangium aurantiacum]|uniref:SIR2 family NAD-dependent protein deacylase n=1 Tax=Cryptosporangium aurantiacum TaxID=134849 RepID=UPI0011612461|nr:SIR2 family protein [Cryptosporangium aurantiacum]
MSQYAVSVTGDAVYFKDWVCRRLRSCSPPRGGDPAEPHSALAGFPLPIYLTTNYDDYMASALAAVNRKAVTGLCPWAATGRSRDDVSLPRDAEFTVPQPLVYHLHGSFHSARTLVVTEDDYLEFMLNLARDQRSQYRRLLPGPLYPAITHRPLLFVGYSLHDWTFRALFHGLFKATARVQWRRHVSIQLLPPLSDRRRETAQHAKTYLERYLAHWNISVYWGTAESFFAELTRRGGTS